jgi:hypothetical protein
MPRPRPHVIDWGFWGAIAYAAVLVGGVLFFIVIALLIRLLDS